jgi:hypothetical protein
MSTLNESSFVTISFSLSILISGTILYTNTLQHNSDIYMLYILLISSLFILTSPNTYVTDFAHFLFMAYIYLVSIFSSNIYLLILNLSILIVILLSRHYYKYCVINNKQSGKGPFEHFNNKYVNTKGTTEQGNILFCGTILFILLKLYVI